MLQLILCLLVENRAETHNTTTVCRGSAPRHKNPLLRWRVHLFWGHFLCSISLYLQNYAVVGIYKINFDCSENNLH